MGTDAFRPPSAFRARNPRPRRGMRRALRRVRPPREAGRVRRIVLVGFMAAGKTVVGRELARRLRWEHLDLDRAIERREGRSVAQIFAEDGEARFRELEVEATAAAAERSSVVISPGGGWITRPELLEALGPGTLSVWLRVSADEAVRRASASPGVRPLLAGPDPLAAARALLAVREPLYARADVHVWTDARPRNDVIAEIIRAVWARA